MAEEQKKVQGKNATDIEYRLAQALYKNKLEFIFQFPILGGRRVAGGMVVDFLVYTPFSVPVEVFGEYWHGTYLRGKDKIKIAILENYFKREVKIAWSGDLETDEMAMNWVRSNLK